MTKRHPLSASVMSSALLTLLLPFEAGAEDVAQADQTAQTPGGTSNNSVSTGGIQEVIVTAQKREERLQDVPISVTALSANTLLETNQSGLQDYFSTIPGMSFTTSGSGQVEPTIRGINVGGSPTVAATLDDVPVGTSSGVTGNQLYTPDIDPSSLSQVEVLRGPQGTLYGANSLGGVIRYVTSDPSPSGFSGRVQVDGDGIHNGNGLGYVARGSVNLPATDTLAFRVSAFTRLDPGYVDDPAHGLSAVNRSLSSGGLASALWRPNDDLSIKLNALIQNTTIDGSSRVQSNLGDLQQDFLPGTGTNDIRLQLYSANIHARLGGIELSSVTGYSIQEAIGWSDTSNEIPGTGLYSSTRTNRFTQEIRLSSSVGHVFDWRIGGYYSHESSPADQGFYAWNPATGAPDPTQGQGGLLVNSNFPSTFEQYAAFADVTVHFTDQFDLQLGGRASHDHQVYDETDSGPLTAAFFGQPSPYDAPTLHSNDNSFTYLVTPQWRFSQNLMAYARVASGFRPGGPNPDAILFGAPETYGPDKTTNYEVGLKGSSPDHLASFETAVYYIDWNDIQLNVINNNVEYFANGGRAKSEGVELSGQVQPVTGLTISGWVAWNEAVIRSNPADSAVAAAPGDRLPNSSRGSGNLAMQQDFPIGASSLTGHVRGSLVYMGDQLSGFSGAVPPGRTPAPRLPLPSYATVNLLAGVSHDTWTVNVYANNVTDRRGALSVNPWLHQALVYVYVQPCTVGLSVSKSF